jgi:hypothetical protein
MILRSPRCAAQCNNNLNQFLLKLQVANVYEAVVLAGVVSPQPAVPLVLTHLRQLYSNVLIGRKDFPLLAAATEPENPMPAA